jgi:SAM-dependent methyltransferase
MRPHHPPGVPGRVDGEVTADRTAARNGAAWDTWSDTYQAKHGWLLAAERAAAWGLWRIPEDELQVLGQVRGRLVLELGCGAAHWSAALARRGARVVGLDISANQLRHARTSVAGQQVALVQAAAPRLPFRDATFDTVMSDYGAMSWCDPSWLVPEVSRVLRPGGLLAFCTASPFFLLCLDPETGELRPSIQRDYFSLRTRQVAGVGTDFHLPFGAWIRLFRDAGMFVEDLLELAPPDDAFTTFRDRPVEFARRCPVENVWRVRKH